MSSVIPTATNDTTAVLDLLPVGALIVASDLTIVKWNRALEEWTGVAASDATGSKLTSLFPNLANSHYEKRLNGLFKQGLPVVFSASLHRHFLPIRPRHGMSLGTMVQQTEARLLPGRRDQALICIQDVSLQYFHITRLKQERAELVETQRQMRRALAWAEECNSDLRQAQETLRESREYTDNIISTMIDMLVVVEPDGTMSRVNPALCKVLGYAEKELLGQPVRRLFDPAATAATAGDAAETPNTMEGRLIGSLFSDRYVHDLEGSCQTKDGRTIDVIFSGAVMRNRDGSMLGAVCVLQDISERKRAQSEMARSQKLESLGQLAAGVAHEINTPMQCVASNVEYLEGSIERLLRTVDQCVEMLHSPPEAWGSQAADILHQLQVGHFDVTRQETPEAIRDAGVAVTRVIEIVRAMKALSHQATRQFAEANVNQLVRDAATICANRLRTRADVKLLLDDNLPTIHCVQPEVVQVVLNLLMNAGDAVSEKFTGDQDRGTIWIRTMLDGEQVVIEVEDNGPGIPEKLRERVFEPFFTTKDVGQGSGQGLAFCYQAVTAHHGAIDLFSREGEGTTFVVALPLDPEAAMPHPVCRVVRS